jgi:hypothetical protein
MKKCTKCGVEKPLSEFTKKKSNKDGLDLWCKTCKSICSQKYLARPENAIENRKKATAWNKQNPEKRRVIMQKENYKRRYGLTIEQKQELIDKQNSKCAICKDDLKHTHNVCVDHNHETGSVRGILCRKCNLGIGHLQDSITVLKAAIKYLSHYENWGSIKKA